jgi:hypothetical protein
VYTTSDLAVAESDSVEPVRWRQSIDLVIDSFAGWFARGEPRRAAAGLVDGLLADLQIKTLLLAIATAVALRFRIAVAPAPTPRRSVGA